MRPRTFTLPMLTPFVYHRFRGSPVLGALRLEPLVRRGGQVRASVSTPFLNFGCGVTVGGTGLGILRMAPFLFLA